LPFYPLLKLKKDQKFTWGDKQQKAFDEIKQYMKEPPVLVPPQLDKPFKLYVAVDTQTIGSALIQESLVQFSTSMTKRFGHGTCKFGHRTLFYDKLMTKLNWSQKLRHIWSTMTNWSFWS
jgi:hypothetical protein